MSITTMSEVWELDIPTAEKLVLLAIADNADDDGFCYPGKKHVARKCCLTDRDVMKHISRLQDRGIIEINEISGEVFQVQINIEILRKQEGSE